LPVQKLNNTIYQFVKILYFLDIRNAILFLKKNENHGGKMHIKKIKNLVISDKIKQKKRIISKFTLTGRQHV